MRTIAVMPPNPPKPRPPLDMHTWDRYVYWRRDNARLKQYWYASFCLMMSSVHDRLTGLALREADNLNWATTAFYYSAVHAGRLLCFLCSGDYPKRHDNVANLLAAGANGPVQFNWLQEFHDYVGASGAREQISEINTTATWLRPSLEAAIKTDFPGMVAAVDRFAPLLSKFRNLRNDCNYEAFLVAHERDHELVTGGFKELATAAERASETAVIMAVGLYVDNVLRGESFEQKRQQFIAAHNRYLRRRLEQSLAGKFRESRSAMAALRTVRDALKVEEPAVAAITPAQVEAFDREISYGQFGQKQGLMDRWKRDVDALKAIVGT